MKLLVVAICILIISNFLLGANSRALIVESGMAACLYGKLLNH